MKGQPALELLFDFLLVLVLVGIAVAALGPLHTRVQGAHAQQELRLYLEAEARALDGIGNFPAGRAYMQIGPYGVDNYSISQRVGDQWIRMPTLFGGSHALEPV